MWPTLDAPCLKQMHPVLFFFSVLFVFCSVFIHESDQKKSDMERAIYRHWFDIVNSKYRTMFLLQTDCHPLIAP